jgi:hypothetical protein
MGMITKILLTVFIAGLGFGGLFVGLWELKLSERKLTFFQKTKKSLVSGFSFSLSILSFFVTTQRKKNKGLPKR